VVRAGAAVHPLDRVRTERLKAPRDKRLRGKKWGRSAVINLLRRTKYIGIWEWGVSRNHRDPETGDIYKELRDEDEWKSWVRHLPELKIVDVEVFAAAQQLLDENEEKCADFRGEEGTFTGSPKDRANPRHLLQRRIRCSECGGTSMSPARAGWLARERETEFAAAGRCCPESWPKN
jgi:hypothetical protein